MEWEYRFGGIGVKNKNPEWTGFFIFEKSNN